MAEAPGAGGTSHEPAGPAGRRSRGRRTGVVVAAVLTLGVGAGVVVGGFGGPGRFVGSREAPEPVVVVLPSPTPTITPVARPALTPFADSLPPSVLDHALSSVVEEPLLLGAGALEGYRLTYSDGGAGVVTVLAGQWATPEDAAAAMAVTTPAAAPLDDGGPTSGEVVAGGAPAGTWQLTTGPDGLATLTWRNGTALLQVVAPPDAVRDVYAAFPL